MSAVQSPWLQYELGLVTLEMITAFKVSAAHGDNLFDSVFVTDANGLPCIPGESLTGVLRHALAEDRDPNTDKLCCDVFGFQDRDKGSSSRVKVSFAHVHNSKDRPVAFWGEPPDEALTFLQAGVGRDHVRIGKHGAVEGRGKFDELVVPAGARFTFELCVSQESPRRFAALVALLARPGMRLGGGGRKGLGAFKVVQAKSASFDVTKADTLQRLASLPVAIPDAYTSSILRPVTLAKASQRDGWIHGSLTLTPIGTWAIGGGVPMGGEPEPAKEGKTWDRLPLRERRLTWSENKGTVTGAVTTSDKAPYLVPGSSVKGALRHRAAFHARRLASRWLDEITEETIDQVVAEEVELFGQIRDQSEGAPGRVYISDIYLDCSKASQQVLQHVSLDRFTQAAMDHLLYDEVVLSKGELKLDIAIHVGTAGEVSERAQDALAAALLDFSEGRLGVGVGRGHGRFRGSLSWADNKGLQRSLTCHS